MEETPRASVNHIATINSIFISLLELFGQCNHQKKPASPKDLSQAGDICG